MGMMKNNQKSKSEKVDRKIRKGRIPPSGFVLLPRSAQKKPKLASRVKSLSGRRMREPEWRHLLYFLEWIVYSGSKKCATGVDFAPCEFSQIGNVISLSLCFLFCVSMSYTLCHKNKVFSPCIFCLSRCLLKVVLILCFHVVFNPCSRRFAFGLLFFLKKKYPMSGVAKLG